TLRVINASKRAAALALIALFILSCVPRAHARHHRQRSSQSKSNSAKISLTATVDFDADAAQDRATLQSNGFDKTIRLRFGDARRADLAFATGFQADPIRVAHLSSRELLKGQSLFVCYLRKRGPPSVLS